MYQELGELRNEKDAVAQAGLFAWESFHNGIFGEEKQFDRTISRVSEIADLSASRQDLLRELIKDSKAVSSRSKLIDTTDEYGKYAVCFQGENGTNMLFQKLDGENTAPIVTGQINRGNLEITLAMRLRPNVIRHVVTINDSYVPPFKIDFLVTGEKINAGNIGQVMLEAYDQGRRSSRVLSLELKDGFTFNNFAIEAEILTSEQETPSEIVRVNKMFRLLKAFDHRGKTAYAYIGLKDNGGGEDGGFTNRGLRIFERVLRSLSSIATSGLQPVVGNR